MKTTFLVPDWPNLSAEELSSVTGEPSARLQQLRSLRLICPDAEQRFAPKDIERVRLVQFLERQQIPLETIARGERDEAVLTSVVDFLYPRGVGRRYSFTDAVEIVGLNADVARRLREASAPSGELMDEHDVRMLGEAKAALDAGFPEDALLQVVRVYADALERVAEAEVSLVSLLRPRGTQGDGPSGPRPAREHQGRQRTHVADRAAVDRVFPPPRYRQIPSRRHGVTFRREAGAPG